MTKMKKRDNYIDEETEYFMNTLSHNVYSEDKKTTSKFLHKYLILIQNWQYLVDMGKLV